MKSRVKLYCTIAFLMFSFIAVNKSFASSKKYSHLTAYELSNLTTEELSEVSFEELIEISNKVLDSKGQTSTKINQECSTIVMPIDILATIEFDELIRLTNNVEYKGKSPNIKAGYIAIPITALTEIKFNTLVKISDEYAMYSSTKK